MVVNIGISIIKNVASWLLMAAFRSNNHQLADQIILLQDAMREAGWLDG